MRKDDLIKLGKQCFIDRIKDIKLNHGIVKDEGLSSLFIYVVEAIFPKPFKDMLQKILSQDFPGRNLYPSPLLMYQDIFGNLDLSSKRSFNLSTSLSDIHCHLSWESLINDCASLLCWATPT